MKNFIAVIVAGLMALSPTLALAQTAGVTATVGVSANGTSINASSTMKLTAAETKAQSRAGQEIDRRTSSLQDLLTRVSQMQKVSDQFKSSLSTAINAQIGDLATLKAKIDADTDLATLKTDVQSITQSYRIYALILPQARISAAADRIVAIASMMSTMGGKLQTRIQAGASAGNDVTALNTALADLSAKIQDAQTQAQTSVNAVVALAPDNGDKTKMAANTTALKQGRDDIVAGQKDLATARQDIATILSGLKGLHASASASSTTQASTTTP